MLKLFFQKLQIRPILGKQPSSWGTAKDYPLGTSGGIQAIVFQGGAIDHLPLETANCPGQERCSFFYLTLPEFQNPSPHLVYSLL